jgi:hypothetical protein
MTTRSREWWTASILVALLGCGSSGDTSGSNGRGNGSKVTPGVGSGTGNAGSGVPVLDGVGNPTMPAPPPRSAPINPEMPCASTSIVANRVLPTVFLVVDGSTSMHMPYGTISSDGGTPDPMMMAPAGPSRWSAIKDALVKSGVGVVPALEGLVHFGLAVFGTAPTCPLPTGIVPPVRMNYMPINDKINGATPPNGDIFAGSGISYTPTGLALDEVVKMMPDYTLAVDKVIGPQIIVLATDGEPNSCDNPQTNYQPSIAAAMAAQAKHIKMFVISVAQAGGEFAGHLQEMSNIGAAMPPGMNAPVYYPEDPAMLAETLKTLIGDQLSCDLALEGKGVKMGLECMGTVLLNGMPLECNGPNGWKLTDETHIQLQGTACDLFKDAVDARLTANFPCQIIITI